MYVETHNRIRKIGGYAFFICKSLPRIDIKSVVEICDCAFYGCESLQFVEFCDKLESIRYRAFSMCPIEHLKLPSIVSIDDSVFLDCQRLIDVEFSEKLERVSNRAFVSCERLQRVAIPLKRGLLSNGDGVFRYCQQLRRVDLNTYCQQLRRVDLVGGVHQTVATLHMKSWRAEMKTEINRINLLLPDAAWDEKTQVIRQWMDSVIDRMDNYKAEHTSYVKEAATLLELALWKAKLIDKEDDYKEHITKKAKIDDDEMKKERRVTCGADTVIKNVLPFLRLLE